ncbi:nuclear transport factor 2 domain-containing protein [Xylariaceae sp. FL0016]|nr:nuclear transport factor 2 domain-containing protein [Xylariaceae sp. FL0016]
MNAIHNVAPEDVANQVSARYFELLQSDKKAFIETFYRNHSSLTFESNTLNGLEAIGGKWTEPFVANAKFQVTTANAQHVIHPGIDNNQLGLTLVQITGLMQLSADDAPMNFTSSLLLAIDADSKGTPYCLRDIFKLVYG